MLFLDAEHQCTVCECECECLLQPTNRKLSPPEPRVRRPEPHVRSGQSQRLESRPDDVNSVIGASHIKLAAPTLPTSSLLLLVLQSGMRAYRPGLKPWDQALWHPQCGSGLVGCMPLAALHLVNTERERADSKRYLLLRLSQISSLGSSFYTLPPLQSAIQSHAISGGHVGSSRRIHNSSSRGPFARQRYSATAESDVRSTISKISRQQAQSAQQSQSAQQAVGPSSGLGIQVKCGSAFSHLG